jgi:cytidylate kinase
MTIPDIIIAVDGHSSTGKSTFAKLASKEFNLLYLDSGAMYRGVTLAAMELGLIGPEGELDLDGIRTLLETLDLKFVSTPEGSRTFIGDRCVESEIRTLAVSNNVSPVSAIGFVRAWVDERLRAMSRGGRVIMDGRDIGTTVFPNAELKIFMTAEARIRAQRRFDEMVSKGENPVFEDVLKNIEERDYIDSHREVSPLRRADDAYVMDNSDMTLHEETVWLRGLVQGKFGILE